MISYAQNAEDVVLARLFAGQAEGRYVDVGAADPETDSVTKHFYDLGWHGINIEPLAEQAEELHRARPRDVTLAVALGAAAGDITLHRVENRPGWSTVDDGLAEEYRDDQNLRVVDVPVRLRTLADVLDEYPGPVDFVKIDVEGAERAVIEGADWSRHRPRVIVVEATAPGSPTPAHESWEPLLLAAGYRCALFDGLNRFYAQQQDTEALTRLAAPANVFDDFERAAMANVRVQHAADVGYIRRLEDNLREAQSQRLKEVEYARTQRDALRDAQRQAVRTGRYVAALERRVAELEAQRPG